MRFLGGSRGVSIVREQHSVRFGRKIKSSEQLLSEGILMSTPSLLGDTYVAAIQHELVDLPKEATLVGVARQPTGWFRSAVDENYPSLGPPPELLDEFTQRHEDFKLQGMCDEGAHNAAWDELGFDDQYLTHIEETTTAQETISALVHRLEAGEELVLVCFENTNQKRCHRTLLRNHIADRL